MKQSTMKLTTECVSRKKNNAQVLWFIVLNALNYTKLLNWKKEIYQLLKNRLKNPNQREAGRCRPISSLQAWPSPLQTGEIWKYRLCVLKWTESILEMELFESNGVAIILWFPCPSFPQPRIQNKRWLLRFQIPWAYCGRKTFDAFSVWNLRFHVPSA